MKKGFTLVEILVAVMIVAILVTMAVPMYDKAVEKSRIAEARATLKKVFDSKLRLMDSMDLEHYSADKFGFENLDLTLNCSNQTDPTPLTRCHTKDFIFVLNPTGAIDGVCAVRNKGQGEGVNFLYTGELTAEGEDSFKCNNGAKNNSCELYGLVSTGSGWCAL